jgi:hypothetical protein
MKRDMDLIRNILFSIERFPAEGGGEILKLEGHTDNDISYHVMLLDEAGLIKAVDLSASSDILFIPIRLTWQGHEFLDAARDDTRWNKTKDAMAKAGGFVFEVAKVLLIELMKKQLIP